MKPDTIFALATPPGRSGVAVIRISGPLTPAIVGSAVSGNPPAPRRAALRNIVDQAGALIDQALVLLFPAPASFTGEDCAEFQVHGGPAVIEAVLDRIMELGGRPAEAGEFTRRAFEHGKLDLTEAEGLADLIEAETSGQREQALSQMTGALRSLYDGWRTQLISIMAAIEGEIDFPDEEGVPDHLARTALLEIEALGAEMNRHLDDNHRGEKIRTGFDVAIIGPPNAGKSSLLNALAKRDAAIVTDIPGTTRDVVEVRLVVGGFAVTLADTAGLRESNDRVEQEGVRRALTRADSADLVVAVLDGHEEWNQEMTPVLGKSDLVVLNKADLGLNVTLPDSAPAALRLSIAEGDGLAELEQWLEAEVRARLGRREMPALSRARHRRNVERAREALSRAAASLGQPELAGEDLRMAIQSLESLTGRVDIEDVLGEVFSRFCVGK
ncbi:tRNA uridine-5-carboxymethylaminomethyl(34) synthesis GTPase MnmE [Hyphobacterium sp.]|uniref:tRNA uridine-5-carboxymethylaminomethyl(34) synthesis GTPase MnmE n=1 Tax=Hyphobacterium sp. TaxID=2004662 RepID=UPI00374955FE